MSAGSGVRRAVSNWGAFCPEDALEGLDARGFDLYVGTSSGATWPRLAGGLSVQRLYRALLDPATTISPSSGGTSFEPISTSGGAPS